MNEVPPYNDAQESDVPLPDVNKAWQKMEVLLHEDERRRRAVPWWFWRTAAGILLLLGTAFGGWWLLRSKDGEEKNRKPISLAAKEQGVPGGDQNERQPIAFSKPSIAKQNGPVQGSASPREKNAVALVTPPAGKPAPSPQERQRYATNSDTVVQKEDLPQRRQPTKAKPANTAVASLPLNQKRNTNNDETKPYEVEKKKEAVVPLEKEKDPLQASIRLKKDSINKTDSAKAAMPPVVPTEEKKTPSKKAAFVFSAGLGLQQAIALQRQPSAPTDTTGRKPAFFDYFPSVYVKAERGRWAAQAGFQYSVPQPVANFSFSQKTTYDAATTVLQTERINLRKLYYHQLPVSLNYRLLPQWSAGVGGVYNIFAGAVTEREVRSKYGSTGAEAVSKNTEPIKGYKDSFFYKTTAGLLLQTDYHWKRFSLGLRYIQNLQPFIKYTRPDGTVLDKKNNALQAILLFQLWKSR